MKDPKVIALGVRERAMRGVDSVEIALWVKSELGNDATFLAFAFCFFHGLGVPVHAIRQLEGWNGA
ncbi:hypothetical protein [Streptomyces sp. NBC_00280]|uniref:hypothetical protein n=1 Tax=Streptomyces sp. NBC_00280 TaxID=2975699 RepID=UPI00324A4A30